MVRVTDVNPRVPGTKATAWLKCPGSESRVHVASGLISHSGVRDLSGALRLSKPWFPVRDVGTVESTLQCPCEKYPSE